MDFIGIEDLEKKDVEAAMEELAEGVEQGDGGQKSPRAAPTGRAS